MRNIWLVVALAAGCGEPAPASLTGLWGDAAALTIPQTMRLDPDARYSRQPLNETGTWEADASTLRLTPDGAIPWPDLRFHLDGDKLTLWWPPAARQDYVRVK